MKRMLLVIWVSVTLTMLALLIKRLPQSPQPQQELPQYEEIVPPPESKYEDAIATIDQSDLKNNLVYLASEELEGRMSGKKGNVVAAEFIKKKFESFGLKTMYHKFKINRVNPGPKNETGDDFTQNIYAWIEGTDPVLKNEIVVIGAHMDHIGYGPSMSRARGKMAVHPGADDNASGTVALLEIAEAFSKIKSKCRRTIVFQSYSAEEMGLIGSRYYCNNPVFPESSPSIKSHVFMLNMDMIGYLGRGQYFAGFDVGDSSIDLRKIVSRLDGKYSFAKKITSHGSGGSDHASFYNKKVPVAFLHTGLHAHYHTPTDTADRINFDGLEKVAKYAFDFAFIVATDDQSPKFNFANFKEMPYTHDHGHSLFHDHDHDHGD